MSQTTEALQDNKGVELAGVNFESPEIEVKVMTSLAEFAAKWTQKTMPDIKAKQAAGERIESIGGLSAEDFEQFVGEQAPTFSEEQRNLEAAKLELDVMRFTDQSPMPESSVLENPQLSRSAVLSPSDVMKYAIHKIKETGLPFEGSPAETAISESYNEYRTALGYDTQNPNMTDVTLQQEMFAA